MMVRKNFDAKLRGQLRGTLGDLARVMEIDVGFAEEIALLIPEHSFGGRVDAGDEAALIHYDDGERGAGDDRSIEGKRLLQVLFTLEAGGDIAECHRDAVLKFDDLDMVTTRLAFGLEDRVCQL